MAAAPARGRAARAGEAAEAEEALTAYLQRCPSAPAEAWLLAELYAESGAAAEAGALEPRLDEEHRRMVPGLLASWFAMGGKIAPATEYLERARQRDPAGTLTLAAALFVNPDQPSPATLRALQEARPVHWLTRVSMGRALSGAGRAEEAERSYRSALELAPEQAVPHRLLAQFLGDHGRRPEANAEYRVALELDRGDVDTRLQLSVLLDHSGATRDAIQVLEGLDPPRRTAELHDQLGRFYDAVDRPELALREYRAAVGAGRTGGALELRLATVLQRLGKEDEARLHLSRAVSHVGEPRRSPSR